VFGVYDDRGHGAGNRDVWKGIVCVESTKLDVVFSTCGWAVTCMFPGLSLA